MEIDELQGNCGVAVISDLALYAQHLLMEVCRDRFDEENNPPFYIFSDVTGNGNGTRLAAYIKKNKLGTLVETRTRRNPNSGNGIKIWIWDVDSRALRRWWIDNKEEDDDNYGTATW